VKRVADRLRVSQQSTSPFAKSLLWVITQSDEPSRHDNFLTLSMRSMMVYGFSQY